MHALECMIQSVNFRVEERLGFVQDELRPYLYRSVQFKKRTEQNINI